MSSSDVAESKTNDNTTAELWLPGQKGKFILIYWLIDLLIHHWLVILFVYLFCFLVIIDLFVFIFFSLLAYTPSPGNGDRVFYETLLEQRPDSEMAQKWCVHHGVLGMFVRVECMYVCMYVCMYLYMHVCMCVCIYVKHGIQKSLSTTDTFHLYCLHIRLG